MPQPLFVIRGTRVACLLDREEVSPRFVVLSAGWGIDDVENSGTADWPAWTKEDGVGVDSRAADAVTTAETTLCRAGAEVLARMHGEFTELR
jgi:hypothetical protein